MACQHMIGKKMEGSGLADVLLEANLISSGSMSGVISGKNFSRAMRCHKVMYESLSRLLLEEFAKLHGSCLSTEEMQNVQEALEEPSHETLTEVLNDLCVLSQVEKYKKFCDEIRQGNRGKTAEF